MNVIFDFANILFIVFSIVYYNMIFLDRRAWPFITFFTVIVAMSVYTTRAIYKMKYVCVGKVVEAYDQNEDANQREREDVKELVVNNIQISDLVEFSLGRCSRFIADISLFFLLYITGIAQLAIASSRFDMMFTTLNCTTENSSDATEANCSFQASDREFFNNHSFQLFVAVVLPLSCCFGLLVKNMRHFGVVSLVGLVASVWGTYAIVRSIFDIAEHKLPESYYGTQNYEIYIFANATMQFAALALPIENSMVRFRKQFYCFFILAVIFTLGAIILIGVSLTYLPEKQKRVMPLRAYLASSLEYRIVNTLGFIMLYFPMMLPCFSLMERRLFSNTAIRNREEREREHEREDEARGIINFEPIFPNENRTSVFLRLHGTPNVILSKAAIESTVSEEHYNKKRYLLRAILIGIQWLFVWLCREHPVSIWILLAIETIASLFIGYLLPVFHYIKNQWDNIGSCTCFFGWLVVILGTLLSIGAYILDEYVLNKFILHIQK